MEKENIRVAIYTRKSVEEGLEQDFNSLEAQREAVENYIASQKCNGLTALPKHYDDGGFTGANINRPALAELLADIDSGEIDMVAVYKIDRLSRSLLDFAELFKHFESKKVKFLSVTQQIDTSTPAGRMTLNILMTFAQFEREMISDRVRDKVVASKKKGMWMGGCVPFGYRAENKRLVKDCVEAPVVREMFLLYIATGSTHEVAKTLNGKGCLNRKGGIWCGNALSKILVNPVYKGYIGYKGELYKGEHLPIVSEELWDQVAKTRSEQLGEKTGERHFTKSMAPLQGILRCGRCGCVMSPTSSIKRGIKYSYYVCSKTGNARGHCRNPRIPAAQIEGAVFDQILKLLKTETVVGKLAARFGESNDDMKSMLSNITDFWDMFFPVEKIRIVKLLVSSAVLNEESVDIRFNIDGARELIEEIKNGKCQ